MQEGIAYAALAYILWGLFPLYFRMVRSVSPLEVLAHRVVWSLAVVAVLLVVLRRTNWLGAALRSRRVLGTFGASAALIGINWFVYIWAVQQGRVVDASLGYFVTPLANVLMGRLVLRERLSRVQWAAVGVASAAVVWLTLAAGSFPWIALTLAASFSTYGLIRKTAPLGALEGLTIETLLLAPLAFIGMGWATSQGLAAFPNASTGMQLLLAFSGPLTAAPLLLFAAGARRIPLSVLGMLQYLGPTLQLVLGVWLFGEPFGGARLVGFVMIWSACALFSFEAWRQSRPAECLVEPD